MGAKEANERRPEAQKGVAHTARFLGRVVTWVHLLGVPPWTTLVRKRVKSPLVIRPRKEAPKERLEIIGQM